MPSATRDAAETSRARAIAAPAPRRGRPDILVHHFAAPPALSGLAGLLTERIAGLSDVQKDAVIDQLGLTGLKPLIEAGADEMARLSQEAGLDEPGHRRKAQ